MSRILDLGKSNENLVSIILEYEDILSGYENNLTLKNKTLEQALKEQAGWVAYYHERRVELKTIVQHIECQLKRVRGQLYVQYNENYNPALGDRAIEKYIDREPEYLNMYQLLLEVQEILEKYNLVLDAFNRRGFVLRDITASRVAAVNDITL